MATDESLEKFRQVTKILADLDLLFCVTSQTGARDKVWVLNPINDPERPDDQQLSVTIQLRFDNGWLHVWSLVPIEERQLGADTLLRLLKVNIPVAKISLVESPPGVIASAQIAEARVDLPSLKDALGFVLVAARLARAALKPPQAAPTTY